MNIKKKKYYFFFGGGGGRVGGVRVDVNGKVNRPPSSPLEKYRFFYRFLLTKI